MRKTIYAILTAAVTLLTVSSHSVYADREGYDQEEYEMAEVLELMMDIRKSRVLDLPSPVEIGEVPKATVITIDVGGPHLPVKQTILFVGPINNDYFLFPFDSGSGASPHKWLSGVYKAKYYGEPAGMKTFTVEVKVKDPAQHANMFGTPHNYVMIIEEQDAKGPKQVSFSSPAHEGSAGSHGGGAHGSS